MKIIIQTLTGSREMKANQKYSPKYWVAHDPRTDDVYLDTASKSYDGCIEKLTPILYGKEDTFRLIDEGKIEISLIEIKLIKMK